MNRTNFEYVEIPKNKKHLVANINRDIIRDIIFIFWVGGSVFLSKDIFEKNDATLNFLLGIILFNIIGVNYIFLPFLASKKEKIIIPFLDETIKGVLDLGISTILFLQNTIHHCKMVIQAIFIVSNDNKIKWESNRLIEKKLINLVYYNTF